MKSSVSRVIPMLGWGYLLLGAVAAATGRAPQHRGLRAVWWVDAFLSVVVHAVQIPAAVRAAEAEGGSRLETIVMTQVFGMTWNGGKR